MQCLKDQCYRKVEKGQSSTVTEKRLINSP